MNDNQMAYKELAERMAKQKEKAQRVKVVLERAQLTLLLLGAVWLKWAFFS